MRKRILIAGGAISLVALLAVPFAFAHGMHGARGDGGAMFMGHLRQMKSELGLSDQQTADIKAAFQGLRDQNKAYRQSKRESMAQAAQILIKNPNDIAGAQAVLDQQIESERAMRANALSAMSKALNVLTPDQRTKLGTMVQEHLNRRLDK